MWIHRTYEDSPSALVTCSHLCQRVLHRCKIDLRQFEAPYKRRLVHGFLTGLLATRLCTWVHYSSFNDLYEMQKIRKGFRSSDPDSFTQSLWEQMMLNGFFHSFVGRTLTYELVLAQWTSLLTRSWSVSNRVWRCFPVYRMASVILLSKFWSDFSLFICIME